MTSADLVLLVLAGLVGGACNAMAGGGTFFTFPALMAVGLPPVVANATSAIAIWPGHAVSLVGYRAELARQGARLRQGAPAFVAGSVAGAVLLIVAGNAVFRQLIPWLILTATLLFALGPRLRRWVLVHRSGHVPAGLLFAVDFVVAVYGGFFGAGLGILLMAVLTLGGLDDLNDANAVKNALSTIASTVAVLVFAGTGVIAWGPAAAVLAGAMAGGYIGARIARAVPAWALRTVVIALGLLLFVYYL